jgi:hypothetical protein
MTNSAEEVQNIAERIGERFSRICREENSGRPWVHEPISQDIINSIAALRKQIGKNDFESHVSQIQDKVSKLNPFVSLRLKQAIEAHCLHHTYSKILDALDSGKRKKEITSLIKNFDNHEQSFWISNIKFQVLEFVVKFNEATRFMRHYNPLIILIDILQKALNKTNSPEMSNLSSHIEMKR